MVTKRNSGIQQNGDTNPLTRAVRVVAIVIVRGIVMVIVMEIVGNIVLETIELLVNVIVTVKPIRLTIATIIIITTKIMISIITKMKNEKWYS